MIRLGDKVLAVRQGKAKQIDGKYPSEVQPLIDSLNRLIADRERSIRRSQAVAGDLAHSLKTPLTILAREVDAARAAGNRELGDSLAAQIERMSSQIEYQLARARTVASAPLGSTRCDVTACAESLLRTLARLHAARQLEITTAIPSGAAVRVLREDLEEILGNVLDNACKWARRRVSLAAAPDGEFLELVVEDDGPGLPQNVRTAVLRRGVRLDESSPGAGLGLSIVCDLVEQYEGTMWIGDSSLGGAAVCVRLPAG